MDTLEQMDLLHLLEYISSSLHSHHHAPTLIRSSFATWLRGLWLWLWRTEKAIEHLVLVWSNTLTSNPHL